MAVVLVIATIIAGYLLGSINPAIIISRLSAGEDIRKSGSGNAGATNVLRSIGKRAAAATMVCDILKGVVAVLIGMALSRLTPFPREYLMMAGGLAAIIGHNYPVYFGFKGGKGINTSAGVIYMLDWRIGIALTVICFLIIAITRYVSLGSIVSSGLFPFAVLFVHYGDWAFLACAVIMAALAIYRHRANIKRLISGTEARIGTEGKKDGSEKGCG